MGERRDDGIVHKINRIAPAPAPFEQRGRRVTFERRNFLHQPEEDKDRKDSERCWVANQHRRDRRINECFGRNRKKDGGYTPAPNRPRQVGSCPDATIWAMAQPNNHAGSAASQTTFLE